MTAAAGVAVTVGVVKLVLIASDTLVLIGLALFIAVGMQPAVSWIVRLRLPRWAAVTLVVFGLLLAIADFFAALITPLAEHATQFVAQVPRYLQQLRDHSSLLRQLNDRFHLQDTFAGSSSGLMQGLLGAGKAILGTLADLLVVLVLSIYFLADFPRIRGALYRLVPNSRRPRAILIGDDIFAKVGAYVLGNVVITIIAGAGTFLWLTIFGVPYAVLLAILVAILDLVPVVGSTAAGIILSLTALTVSVPVCLATVGFFVAYRVIEDYLLVPKIIGRFVQIPALVTVVSVLLGSVLLGVVGALVAIPRRGGDPAHPAGGHSPLTRSKRRNAPGHQGRQTNMQFCARGVSSTSIRPNPASASIRQARSVPHIAPSPAPPSAKDTVVQYIRLIA
jgi:predicted PurR-regulated permease PerM